MGVWGFRSSIRGSEEVRFLSAGHVLYGVSPSPENYMYIPFFLIVRLENYFG